MRLLRYLAYRIVLFTGRRPYLVLTFGVPGFLCFVWPGLDVVDEKKLSHEQLLERRRKVLEFRAAADRKREAKWQAQQGEEKSEFRPD